MSYKRQYHLMEWLSDEHRVALGPDDLLLLRNAFVQFSNVFDEIIRTRANAPPLDYVVSRIYSHFGIPGEPKLSYSRRTMAHYNCIWRLVLLRLDWGILQSCPVSRLGHHPKEPDV